MPAARRRNVHIGIAAVCFGLLCAGCNSAAQTAPQLSSEPPVTRFGQSSPPREQTMKPQTAVNTPAVPGPEPKESSARPVENVPATQDTTNQGDIQNVKQVVTSSGAKPLEAEPPEAPPEPESYQADKPSLMGIRLTDSRAAVVQKYAEPSSQFELEDERDPITVYEYDGFNIGFNRTDKVEFIEIMTDEVNPGLNGLRLGQQVKDAEIALGKPDTNTSYALQYKAVGTILKLDIDHKTDSIVSIKLFADKK